MKKIAKITVIVFALFSIINFSSNDVAADFCDRTKQGPIPEICP